MSLRLHVRPCGDRVVRDPEAGYRPIPAQGAKVHNTPYWRRRLVAGDVERVPAKRKPSKAKSED